MLEWRTKQALEYENRAKRYKNEEIFEDNQMVYLLALHASVLQPNTTKFKQDFIGPLFIDTALDKMHYRLKDVTGLLLDGTYHMNHIKKGSACIPLGIADKFDTYEKALKNTLLKILGKYLEAVEDDLEETAPEYEPIFTSIYQYYGNSLISFTNMINDLLLQLPIPIKLKVQVPMSLFSIETAPVPLDAETYIGEKREYTQIIPETEFIALTETNYVPLTQAQISLCAKIGYMYYCGYAHLLKKRTKHTCMSAIYYDQGSDIKAKQCKTIVTFSTIPESKILDAGDLLILSNLQKLWTIACKDVSQVFEIEYSTYCILNRSELCECSLMAGNYLLSYTNTNCGNAPEARDGMTYYSSNKIVLDVITEKFDIQVDEKT